MKLLPYQQDNANKAVVILQRLRIVYLHMEMRTGKTCTSLEIARLYGAKRVLFITKKKAIDSILSDYEKFGFSFNLTVINDESLSKVTTNDFDLIIQDEAHKLGAFPKPSLRTKIAKLRFGNIALILMTGTMSAETICQIYHQLWVSNASPFRAHNNFYSWAKTYVDVTQQRTSYGLKPCYSEGKYDKIMNVIEPYILRFSQQEGGFESKVNIEIVDYPISDKCYSLIKLLKRDLIIEGKDEVILADTNVKMMQKIHQLENGTIKFESGRRMIFSADKATAIKNRFSGQKIAILYYYIAELQLLKEVFKKYYTTDLNEFNSGNKSVYLGQQYSTAMGVNLSHADALVYYNFGFSGTNFIQSLERMSSKDRATNNVYFYFQKGSLTDKIYRCVSTKKTFNSKMLI